jgi:hypothetical protein
MYALPGARYLFGVLFAAPENQVKRALKDFFSLMLQHQLEAVSKPFHSFFLAIFTKSSY